VLYTPDGGLNWIYRDPPQGVGVEPIAGINAIGPTSAICLINTSSFTGLVVRTTNSGNNWTTVFSRQNLFLDDMKFINALTGYVYGDPIGNRWFFMRTTNGGIGWDTTVLGPLVVSKNDFGLRNSMFTFLNGNVPQIWFGTDGDTGKVFFSQNGGLSWVFSTTANNQSVRGITFLDANTGFCCGNKCFKSNNSGFFWNVQPTYPLAGTCFAFANAGGFLWYTTASKICYSTNTGVSFSIQHTSPDNSDYIHLSFTLNNTDNLSTLVGWGVTDNGIISKLTYGNIGIHQISTEIPQSYKLEQNYPNPFNPSTKIRFSIPREGFISINAYDILGRLVKNIFSGSVKPGNYETDFDASELSSGMYFYKLESGQFSDVKKMIVVK